MIGLERHLPKELKVLNRTIGVCESWLLPLTRSEVTPSILVKELGIKDCNPCATPESDESRKCTVEERRAAAEEQAEENL